MLSLLAHRQQEITELCQHYHVKRLSVFGSAARQHDFSSDSDIDLLVEFERLEPGDKARAYFGLWFSLENLLDKTVDLAEATAFKNPYVQKTVERDLTPFYAVA